jgi:hypothetical protein
MPRNNLPPIEHDSLTYVGIRVGCRLAACDYRRRPEAYSQHPPTAVLHLAERCRMLFPQLYPSLVFIAKALAQGYSLKEVRWLVVDYAPRALHKRRPH